VGGGVGRRGQGGERGRDPAGDPLDATGRQVDPIVIGTEHYDVARRVQDRGPGSRRLQVGRVDLEGAFDLLLRGLAVALESPSASWPRGLVLTGGAYLAVLESDRGRILLLRGGETLFDGYVRSVTAAGVTFVLHDAGDAGDATGRTLRLMLGAAADEER